MIMKHRILPFCVAALFVMCRAGDSPAAYGALQVPERGFISSEPAQTWEQGLICGNSTIGANIFSRPLDETIIFTHERLFLPMGAPTMPPDASSRLSEIRRISVTKSKASVRKADKQESRRISLPARKDVTLDIELK